MLYFVATPIGNLKDESFRAVETLKNSDLILCEDTRTSQTFLNCYQIKKPLESFHKFNYKQATPKVIELLKQGKNISLITDAGMPGISDPGSELVAELVKNNLQYTVIPGASAFLTAFCLSGFPAPFTFVGFLPDNKKEKKSLLLSLKTTTFTTIFYSAPHNLLDDLQTLFQTFGKRDVCIARELTKLHEEVLFANLSQKYPKEPRGEYVIVVKGQTEQICDLNNLSVIDHYQYYTKLGLSNNDAIKQVAKDMGVAKNVIYNQIVAVKQSNKN